MTTPSSILEANLRCIRGSDADLADRLEAAEPAKLSWSEAKDGKLTAVIEVDGRGIQLASRYNPTEEAKKLIEGVDFKKHACIIAMGMGLGYHAAEAARGMGENTLLIVYEPDEGLLRGVLERIDHSGWLGKKGVILVSGEVAQSALLKKIEGMTGMLTQGTVLVGYPPSRQLQGARITAFGSLMTEVISYCRMLIATSLVNTSRTVRNLSLNLAYYAGGANTNELKDAAKGYPAVCVGAGPSLAKNIDLLRDGEVRKKVVLITAQTMLKPLLARGIRPDFVTALDYHEISKRFYEGLPELPGVTLVAEAKANPSVLDSYPGPIRVTFNRFLDRLLGEEAPKMTPIKDGATVAHLSFYLAQHLGCDPILLIGQDLGFSEGLYYCPGTAIHEVWGPELGAFNTLEMMEWQRIVRHRGHLQKQKDIFDRPIYTDEQMTTYLKQFERDFMSAKQEILDATEGGLPKEHTRRVSLKEALAAHATRAVPAMPAPAAGFDVKRLGSVKKLLERRIGEVAGLKNLTKETVPLLKRMRDNLEDRVLADKLFKKIDRNSKEVERMNDIFNLVGDLNVIGVFNRTKADRKIAQISNDIVEKQRGQIDRDLENLDWLLRSCDEATNIFRAALARIEEVTGPGVHRIKEGVHQRVAV